MHSSIRPLVILGLALSVGACGDDDDPEDVVTTRVSPSADFTSYETFRFQNEDDLPPGSRTDFPPEVVANLAVVNDAMRQELLEEGMVFSVEPGIYLPGRFGIRLEVIASVTGDGVSLINAPRVSELPITGLR